TANAPLPSPDDASHPATPNPAVPLVITPAEPEPPTTIRPATADTDQLTKHVRIGATAAYGTFSGSFYDGVGIGSALGGSGIIGLDISVGISRKLELSLVGDYSGMFDGSGCGDCRASSWSVGPTIRYQLLEGTRLSPWLMLGTAYRHYAWEGTRYSGATAAKAIEFLRIGTGADWYVTSNLTFGPTLGFGLISSVDAPDGLETAISAWFYSGLRITFDHPGR
ncbi:MAG TPA: hypothetical protein VIV60_00135, partial [Polyangiaceae bacterium]